MAVHSSELLAPAATLRPARPQDLPAIERLLAAAGLPVEGVADSLQTFVVADAPAPAGIVGVAGLELCREDALLRSVAVDPAWRSHGIGRALVARVISDAEARGLHALYLLTTTAERYFPSFGFRGVAREHVPDGIAQTAEFRSVCPSSAAVMCRSLAAPTTVEGTP